MNASADVCVSRHQLPDLEIRLRNLKIPFTVDENAVRVDGATELAVVNLGSADAKLVQAYLDAGD